MEKAGYVIALNPETKCVAIRNFVNMGNGEDDYEDALDSASKEVSDGESVWAIFYGKLDTEKVSGLIRSLEKFAMMKGAGKSDLIDALLS